MQGGRVFGQTPRGHPGRQQKAAGDICSAGTVPAGAVLVTPPLHLIAPVDHHVPRKGSKAQQGRRRLFPGSCASPWERQQRLVRFHAVITKLGTEKD